MLCFNNIRFIFYLFHNNLYFYNNQYLENLIIFLTVSLIFKYLLFKILFFFVILNYIILIFEDLMYLNIHNFFNIFLKTIKFLIKVLTLKKIIRFLYFHKIKMNSLKNYYHFNLLDYLMNYLFMFLNQKYLKD